MNSYFAHARTGLWYGLQQIPLKKGDHILLPDYICEVMLHPLQDLGLNPIFYNVKDTLETDWDELEAIQKERTTSALVLVHYFGQPQDIPKAQDFCRKHDLFLIEDNAHGYGGNFQGKALGSFGEIGISSPRKQLLSASGGILYLRGKHHPPPFELPIYSFNRLHREIRIAVRYFPRLKGVLRHWLRGDPNFNDITAFIETREASCRSDSKSAKLIDSENWVSHSQIRRESWIAWAEFARCHGCVPLQNEPHPESSPWALPAYAPNPQQRNQLLQEGWRRGYDWFSWPSLPNEVMKQYQQVFERWERLICFPLNRFPE